MRMRKKTPKQTNKQTSKQKLPGKSDNKYEKILKSISTLNGIAFLKETSKVIDDKTKRNKTLKKILKM